MNWDGPRTCARGFAEPEGPGGVFGELAVVEIAGMDFVGWKEWDANGGPLRVFVQEWMQYSVS
jgi:hypothetical protein